MNAHNWSDGALLRLATYEEQVAETIRRLNGFRPEHLRVRFEGEPAAVVLADKRVRSAARKTSAKRRVRAEWEARCEEEFEHRKTCHACCAASLTHLDEHRCEARRTARAHISKNRR